MASNNEPTNCASCNCSFQKDAVENLVQALLSMDINISKMIISKGGFTNNYRVTHSNRNGPPHALCPECVDFYEDLVCRMDTNNFQCPFGGCRRIIITG